MQKPFPILLSDMAVRHDEYMNTGLLGILDRFHYFVFFLIGLAARLPMWLHHQLPLNGDECVLALMGKHLSEGKGASIFFYGQKYFLAIVENVFTGIGFTLAGVSDLTYRVSLLAFASIGFSFFYRFLKVYLKGNANTMYIWGLSICMVLCPAWMRLLYATPFVLTFVLLYVLATHRNRTGYAVLIAILVVLIDQAHRLWTPPVLLLTLAFTLGIWTRKQWLASISTLVICVIAFEWYRIGLHDVWHPNFLDLGGLGYQKLRKLPYQVFVNLSGCFYLSDRYDIPFLVKLCVSFFMAISGLALFRGLSTKNNHDRYLRWALALCLIGIPMYMLIARQESFRYIMPLSRFAFILIGVSLWSYNRKVAKFAIVALLLASVGSAYAFRDFHFYTVPKETITELVEELESKKVGPIFCTEPLAQWQINFYSLESVRCRYFGSSDRYPPYVEENNTWLEQNGSATLVGRKWKIPDLVPDHICADGETAIYYNVKREELEKLQFKFGDPWASTE